MKRLLSLILAIVSFMLLLVPASAHEANGEELIKTGFVENLDGKVGERTLIGTFVKNEYDIFVERQNTPTTTLLEQGYSLEEVEQIKSMTVEEILQQRADMSVQELQNMGYSIDRIKMIKEYDGSPLSESPEVRGVFADITGRLYVETYGKSKMSVMFSWSWSAQPVLFFGVQDIVSCGFAGTNNNNLPCTMRFDDKVSICRVNYYQMDGNTPVYIGSKDQKIVVKNVHQHVEVKFNMSDVVNVGWGWAKSGYFLVGIKEEKTLNRLYSGTFAFGYGHTVFTTTPSISISVGSGVSAGVGLSFGLGTENMFYKTIVLKNTGAYNIYNGT